MNAKEAKSITEKRNQEKRECPLCSYVVINPFARSCPRCNTEIPFEDPGCGGCVHARSCPSVELR